MFSDVPRSLGQNKLKEKTNNRLRKTRTTQNEPKTGERRGTNGQSEVEILRIPRFSAEIIEKLAIVLFEG